MKLSNERFLGKGQNLPFSSAKLLEIYLLEIDARARFYPHIYSPTK